MTTNKMTKAAYFAQIKANYPLTADEIAFIDHELDLLARKNSAERKPTATQLANETIKDSILASMEPNRLYTISEMIKEIPCCAELSNQKVSAIVRQMGDSVEKVVDKRKSYFRKANA